MPIRINDSSNDFSGYVRQTLGDVTCGFVGASDTQPDSDGFLDRQLQNVTSNLRGSLITGDPLVMDNAPFISCAFSLGNIKDRTENNPAAKIITYNNLFISQALFMHDSSNRLETRNRNDALWAINPQLHIIYHIDYLTVSFDKQGTIESNKWLEDLANGITDDDIFLREPSGRGGSYGIHENSASDGFAFNWGCTNATMQQVVERQIDQWTDFDGPNGSINTGRPISWMEDTIPMYDFRYAQTGNQTGNNTIQAQVSSTEFDVPIIDWAGKNAGEIYEPPTDGNGYFSMIANLNLIVRQSNGQRGDVATITGFKNIDGNTDRLRVDKSLENLTTTAAGGEFIIVGKASAQNSLRFFGSSNFGELTQEEWRQGILNFTTRFVDTVKTNYAVDVGAYCNMGARNGTNYVSGDFDTFPHEDIGAWDGFHYERVGQTIGFHQQSASSEAVSRGKAQYHSVRQVPPGGSAGGNTYGPDKMISHSEWNKLCLKDANDSHNGYPTVWLNAQVRSFGNDQGNYNAGWNERDAAYARFWAVFCWGTYGMCPQIEADEGHDVPYWLDEQMIYAGEIQDAWNYGSLDVPTKVVTWNTPDFGTYGFRKRYGNVWTFINLRKPDSDPWWPSWDPVNGQAIDPAEDRYTFADVPAGKKIVHFDRDTYIHPGPGKFTGLRPTDFDDVDPGKDNTLNDASRGPQPGGGYKNGDTMDLGALEACVMLIVDE